MLIDFLSYCCGWCCYRQSSLLDDILEEFVELLSDYAPNVREAAVTNYINLMPVLPPTERQKYCVVGIRKMGVERHPVIARIILHRFGEIFYYLHGIFFSSS